ncbi:6-phospho-beta-glucosidase [Atopostipes suicloacalis DSM 15692]|uniref:6-phospho-beta-glucosidase n=1 Tax=Atopostipes suicloacalis DSM 15692 TaxID=1121025 RepID=A0A1M4YX25_9LACT|nr:glycoside hydrolase family 1 protein [Atopostipes suicloacalis]SHF10351.1 6-phospho-beta-glucosidase [Atopostipes suicloacalis DSM 15692]
MTLKENFYWGNSVSSMQTEGAWNEGGKGKSVYDIREASEFASDWKVATDSYHRYKEDFDIMQDLGMNMYRFQISWSRVNPDGDGEFNEEGIAFYDQFIDDLIARGIEPMICLYHFDMPLILAKKYNGFLSREVTDAFARYGIEMVKRFGHKVKHWITFNEQNLYHIDPIAFRVAGYLEGDQTLDELYQIQHNVMMAHAYVANYIHEETDCQISGMLAYQEVYPATSHPKDVFIAREADEFLNNNLLEVFVHGRYLDSFWTFVENKGIDLKLQEGDLEVLSKVRSDYLTFSYYQSLMVDHREIPEGVAPNSYMKYGQKNNPHLEASEWNWQIDPLGFRNILNKMYARYDLPIFPIENGLGVIEEWDGENMIQDDYRIEYLSEHMKAMKDAVELDGVDVMGYLGWGMIDILSSQGDMRKRYGVVYVNRENHDLKDLKRVPKKSYAWLKQVIQTNGEEL